jgi:hypothetical protein
MAPRVASLVLVALLIDCDRNSPPPLPAHADAPAVVSTTAGSAPAPVPTEAASVDASAPCGEKAPATALAVSGEEAFVGTEGGAVVAIHRVTGRRRRVACGYEDGVGAIAAVPGGLLVSDARGGLWLQPPDGSPRHPLPGGDGSDGFAVAGPDVVIAVHDGDAGRDHGSIRAVPLAGGAVRTLASVQPQGYQRVVVGADSAEVFVAQRYRNDAAPAGVEGVELLRVPLGGGPPRSLIATDSAVTRVVAEAGWYVWYDSGYRSSEWGGGNAPCELLGRREPDRGARTLESFGGQHGDECTSKVWFVLDGAAVVWRSDQRAGVFRRALPGGRTQQLGNPSPEAFGLVRDGDAVLWVEGDGGLGRAGLR